jgi:crossover junction endodeoxyribonuclease RusA
VITLTLPYPISANRYWATRVIKAKATGKWMAMTYITPEAQTYRDQVAWIAKAAGLKQPFEQRLRLDLKLYPQRPQDYARRQRLNPTNWDDDVRCIDLGNAEKVLGDALQGVLYTDDKWVWQGEKQRMEPDGEARVVISITPLVIAQPQASLLEVA